MMPKSLPDERYIEERHTYLCVGGPLDGQRYVPSKDIFVEADCFRVRDPDSIASVPIGPDVPSAVLSAMHYRDSYYRREAIRIRARFSQSTVVEYVYWRHESLDTMDSLTELFKGYKGKDDRNGS